MVGQDMFSLASAAGRSGEDFEQRAETWRSSKGLLAANGSRRLSPSKSNWNLLDLGNSERQIRPSPSMPALQVQGPPAPLPPASRNGNLFRTPTTQVNRLATIPSSASAAALQTFVTSKGDNQYTTQDVDSMEALLRSVKADAMATLQKGGWSGALVAPVVTPGHAASAAPSTPGSAFSMGSSIPTNRGTHRVKYLGPGMSPRRFKSTADMRTMSSLFNDDTPGKKRRTADIDGDMEMDDSPSTSLSSFRSTPNLAAANKAAEFNQRAALAIAHGSHGSHRRPSPLVHSTLASPDRPPTPSDIGRKRVNDIIQDVLDNEITPHEERPKQVFNPYEDALLPSGKHYSPYASFRQSSSSNNDSLRRSITASRGAAARLDSERMRASSSGRPLSTLEMINRGHPSVAAAPPTKKQKQKRADEPILIDDSDDEAPPPPKAKKISSSDSPSSSTPSRKTPAAVTIADPDPVSPFPAPSLSQSTTRSSPAPKPVATLSFPSTADSIFAASKPAQAPVFSTKPLGLGRPPSPTAPAAAPSQARASSRIAGDNAIYLSAKDSALSVDKHALPFYTFTLPPAASQSQPSESVKAVVCLDKPKLDGFQFQFQNTALPVSYLSPPASHSTSVPAAPVPSSSTFIIPKKASPTGAWSCGTCMLRNTAADTEKCHVCKAPKPGAKAAAPVGPFPPLIPPPGGFNFAAAGFKPTAKSAGAWTCDTCMLQNPASETEKCKTCEAPKPGAAAKVTTPSVASAMPAPPSGGFNFGAAGFMPQSKPAGTWTCGMCSLDMTAADTEACSVCESPKPGAALKAAAAAPVAKPAPTAMPAPPPGGFNFAAAGFKPPAKAAGAWSCDLCGLQNTATDTEKCSTCEAPKPGAPAAATSSAAPHAPPTVPASGFSFAGQSLAPSTSTSTASTPAFGGFAPPAAGGFSFGNKAVGGSSAPAPPSGGFSFGSSSASAASSFGGFGGFGVKPPTGGFSFGQKKEEHKPAMLSKPTGAAGEWTCGTCGLANPATATEKCTVCETPK